MNQMNMAGMNPGNPTMAAMPIMNNMPNGAMPRQNGGQEAVEYETRLNHMIYGYFCDKQQWDLARSLKNSSLAFSPPLENSDEELNGVAEDSKNGVADNRKPPDLPTAKQGHDQKGGSFLLGWWSIFWDMYAAQNNHAQASKGANHIWAQKKLQRDNQMLRGPMNGMMGNQMDPNNFQQMMRFGGDLRQKALQNQHQNGYRGGLNPQMQQMAVMQRNAMMQQQQQNMRREPSGMDMNGQRPRTPSSGDHAPSPKRARMDGAGFNAQQMMQNGRPPQGMPQQMMGDPGSQAQQLLMTNGINPANLSESQFASFQQQNPAVQAKSIQVYAQNMAKNQREGMSKAGGMSDGGSPVMADAMNMTPGPDFYAGANGQMMRGGAMGPNPGANGGNHALQDYQMQLMLLEQQNKKRLLMARQEQEGPGQPGMPATFAPGMSPQGSRGGPSPGPGAERRGTPKMGQPGMPGSPLPDGSMRGSPAAMSAYNPMQNEMYAQMNGGGMRPPPSSNPGFNGQYNPQQMEQMRANGQGRMPNGSWQQGPPGQAPMAQQPPNQQQPTQLPTPQRSSEMPPPQAPPPGAANGRTGSDDAPPTPQQTNKANPKGKKEGKPKKQTKKNSTSVAPTPTSEAENQPAISTPSTPITPSHPSSFAQKAEVPQPTAAQATNNSAPPPIAAPQPDLNVPPQFNTNADGTDGDFTTFPFADVQNGDLFDNLNFEEFLDQNAWHMDPTPFDGTEMIDPQMSEVP